MKKNEITLTDLRQRWSKRLVEKYQPKVTRTAKNCYNRTTTYYSMRSVMAIERGDKFKDDYAKTLKRREAMNAYIQRARVEHIRLVHEDLDNAKANFRYYDIPETYEALVRNALYHAEEVFNMFYSNPYLGYIEPGIDDWGHICMNYLRHECSNYDTLRKQLKFNSTYELKVYANSILNKVYKEKYSKDEIEQYKKEYQAELDREWEENCRLERERQKRIDESLEVVESFLNNLTVRADLPSAEEFMLACDSGNANAYVRRNLDKFFEVSREDASHFMKCLNSLFREKSDKYKKMIHRLMGCAECILDNVGYKKLLKQIKMRKKELDRQKNLANFIRMREGFTNTRQLKAYQRDNYTSI